MTDEEKQQYAIIVIRNYLNKDMTDEYITTNFALAINQLINNIDNNVSEKQGISSITQGSQSITYNTNEDYLITNDIKNLLPKPYIKLF